MPDLLINVVGVEMRPGGVATVIADAMASTGASANLLAALPPSQSAAQVNAAIRQAGIDAMGAIGVTVSGGDVITIIGGAA